MLASKSLLVLASLCVVALAQAQEVENNNKEEPPVISEDVSDIDAITDSPETEDVTDMYVVTELPTDAPDEDNDGVTESAEPRNQDEIGEIKSSFEHRPIEKKSICLTRDCVASSNSLFSNMYEDKDPCEDFHEFACGRFVADTIIPDDKGSYTPFGDTVNSINERGRKLLEAKHDDKTDFESFAKARMYYKSCVNEEKLEELGTAKLHSLLDEAGGWPVLMGDKWTGQDYTWWEQTYRMNQLGFGNGQVASLSLSADSKNSSWRVLYLDQPDLGMSKEYLDKGFDDKDVQSYFKYMTESAVFMGADPDTVQAELKPVLEFEIKLANISACKESRRNASSLYNPTTLGEFKTGPGLPDTWTSFVQGLLNLDNVKVVVGVDEKVIIYDKNYYANVSKVLESTDNRVLANYLGWRMTTSGMPFVTKEARDIRQRYRQALTGTVTAAPTWKRCVKTVGFNSYGKNNFAFVAGSMYAKAYFKLEAKEAMVEMTKYIRESFTEILQELPWMDDKTKVLAKEKLEAMGQFIAYPEEILDKDKIDELHQDIVIREDDFLGNALNLVRHWRAFYFNRFRNEIDPNDWIEHRLVAVVNAFYNPTQNNMEFPAGILQGLFFNDKLPKYMNFGAIGSIIGHEITHGFDDQGRQRNAQGDLVDWWQPETDGKFRKRAQCIIEQYGNYTAKQIGANLNGINTQGENIADNGGIKEAYKAYNKWVADHGEEPGLPGHAYSSKQMFWIAFSQVWCSKYRDATLKSRVLTGYHSPGEFRIKGSLSNNDDFARDFNCPLGSKMNPKDKCTVW